MNKLLRVALTGASLVSVVLSGGTPSVAAGLEILPDAKLFGFTPVELITPASFRAAMLEEQKKKDAISGFCAAVRTYYEKYGWREDPCGTVRWKADLKTKNGHPLIYAEFGLGEETTLLLGGVHPDEITPIPIAFRVARHLHENPSLYDPKEVKIVVAPLVNADGFLRNVATRTNANGIDLNRNFFTFDWYAKAKKLWVERRDRSPKHYPGYFPNSEIETLFQIKLIDDHKPDKILSIHAPLGFLDYDGPGDGDGRKLTPSEHRAKQLVHSISAKARNYKVVDYTFFPGSLGNYAGNEREIPTVTLELESTDPKMVDTYWKHFLPGILQSVHYPFRITPSTDQGRDASPLSIEYTSSLDKTTI